MQNKILTHACYFCVSTVCANFYANWALKFKKGLMRPNYSLKNCTSKAKFNALFKIVGKVSLYSTVGMQKKKRHKFANEMLLTTSVHFYARFPTAFEPS